MQKQQPDIEVLALAGASAIASRTISAPVKRLQTLLQCQHELVNSGRLTPAFNGVVDCVKRSVRTEGIWGMWRGNMVHVVSYIPSQLVYFALKDQFKKMIHVPKDASYHRKLFTNMLAGGMSGVAGCLILYPLDYIKIRLNTNIGPKSETQFKGIIDICKQTMKKDGFVGFYRGVNPSIASIFLYRGLYFGIYDSTKSLSTLWNSNPLGNFIYAYAVTLSSGLIVYPLETIRKSMLLRSCEPTKYKHSLDACVKIVKTHGIKTLWRGAGVNVATAIGGSLLLTLYDQITGFK